MEKTDVNIPTEEARTVLEIAVQPQGEWKTMERPEKPDKDANAAEIYKYQMKYEAWCEWKGAQKVAEMNEENDC